MIKNRVSIEFDAKFVYNKNTINHYSNFIWVSATKKYLKLFYCRIYRWNAEKNIRLDKELVPIKNLSIDSVKGTDCYKILNNNEKKVFKKWIPIISLMFDKKIAVDHDKKS